MSNSHYDNDEINTPETAGAAAEPPAEDGVYEEFDISSFDFTIADPGEGPDASDTEEALGSEERSGENDGIPEPKKEKFSLKKLSASLSEKATKLMEETPKTPKTQNPRGEIPAVPRGGGPEQPAPKKERPPRQKLSFGFSGGSFPQIARRWMRYALRPATLYQNLPEWMWPAFLLGVMLFFGGFYLLLGLDWYFAELIAPGRLLAIVAIGFLVGGTAALAFGAGAQGLSLLCRKERLRPFRVLSAVAGACVYPALLLILGLLIQLIFHAAVSMSFGIVAILWLTYVLLDVLRDMFGEKHLFKSTVLTVLWGFLLFIIMTMTFTLK